MTEKDLLDEALLLSQEQLIAFVGELASRLEQRRKSLRPSRMVMLLAFSQFRVMLVGVGDRRVHVMKELREMRGMELVEAQEFLRRVSRVEAQVLRVGVYYDEAESIAQRFRAVGATIEIQRCET